MRIALILLSSTLLITMMGCGSEEEQINVGYPDAPKVDVTDDYFGTKVKDPYRWMENLNSDSVANWVEKENQLFDDYMSQIGLKKSLKEELTDFWDFAKYSQPFRAGEDQYFFFKNDGLQDQDVLYRYPEKDADPEVFLDPNKFSEDGTTALTQTSPSPDGKFLAYGISKAGSDWRQIKIKNTQTGDHLDETLEDVKFSGIAWLDSGFYYSRYDREDSNMTDRNKNHKVYFHKIGTSQDSDRLVYHNPEKPFTNHFAQTTENGKFLIISATKGSSGNNSLRVKNLDQPDEGFKTIIPHHENSYSVIGQLSGELIILTNDKASNYRLIKIDPNNPEPDNWETLIPEKEKAVLKTADLVGNHISVKYMKKAKSQLKLFNQKGEQAQSIALPTMGNVSGFGGRKRDSTLFFTFESFVHPSTIYHYHIKAGDKHVFRQSEVDIDSEKYATKQVSYKSTDGKSVPMFLVHRKNITTNGHNPTLLYGYGGFNITLTPEFDVSRAFFLKNGGVFAMPNLRGGAVYGESWHKAGMKANKQQVFDDFIRAGEALFDHDYTNPNHLAISGRSNGGLLVGAVMTQRPDLMEVALPAVGVMDMLRYHKFTIGWAWASEYGSSDDSTAFEYLYDYSPYHNLSPDTCYPATLVTTADHDDRVVPAHSFKFAARLQEYQSCNNPALISIETKTGHGAGKPVSKTIKEEAEKWAFTFHQLDLAP